MTLTPEAIAELDDDHKRWLDLAMADLATKEMNMIHALDHLGKEQAHVAYWIKKERAKFKPGVEVTAFNFSAILAPSLVFSLLTMQEGGEAIFTFYYNTKINRAMFVAVDGSPGGLSNPFTEDNIP